MKQRIHLVFFFLASSLFGQEGNATNSSVILVTAPVGIIDAVNGPNVNLGCEFGIRGDIRNFFDVGYYVPGLPFLKFLTWDDLNGFYVANEFRYYDQYQRTEKWIFEGYWGIQCMYGNQSYIRTDSVTVSEVTTKKIYHNQRQFIGLTANIGARYEFAGNFIINLNAGFGFRYNQVLNELTQEEAESRELGDWTVPQSWHQKKGNHIIPKFNFTLKLGFRIN